MGQTLFWFIANGVSGLTGRMMELQEQCSTGNAARKAVSVWMAANRITYAQVEVQALDGRPLTEWSQTLPAARGARRAA